MELTEPGHGYYHIVMWHLKDQALGRDRSANAALLKEKLEALRGRIPGLDTLHIGIDVRRRDNSADVVMISRFRDHEALEAYHRHPLHLAVTHFAAEVRSRSTVVDFPSP